MAMVLSIQTIWVLNERRTRRFALEEILETFFNGKKMAADLPDRENDIRDWVTKGAGRISQLSFATHNGKFTHSSVGKNVSCIAIPLASEKDGYLRTGNCDTGSVDTLEEFDCLGNAAALDVYRFLSLQLADGATVYVHFAKKSEYLRQQLVFDREEFDGICTKMLSIKPDETSMETSDLVKQVYFPIGDGYHLLSILTSSVLLTELKARIDEILFSPNAKEGREARKTGKAHQAFAELYNLTQIGFGGTKAQNVGVLNSKNRGCSYLLPSIPPSLGKLAVRLPRKDFFENCLQKTEFKPLFGQIESIVATDRNNIDVRNHRDRIFHAIIDRIIQVSWNIRMRPGGWSSKPYYEKLPKYQRVWLDADFQYERACSDDWKETVIEAMTRWIMSFPMNVKSRTNLGFGDDEFLYVRKLVTASKDGLS
jgi:CRISPR-associated protein Csy1